VTGRSYPFIEPCTRSELYRHKPTNTLITLHRRRGYGQRSILRVSDIGVFFHRGDIPGEGGSGIHWLSKRMWPVVSAQLRTRGLITTGGSMAHVRRQIRQIERRYLSAKTACEQSAHFDKWGLRWTCVGWVSNSRREHAIAFDRTAEAATVPTPLWQLTADAVEGRSRERAATTGHDL
jgi:hypothetical protein